MSTAGSDQHDTTHAECDYHHTFLLYHKNYRSAGYGMLCTHNTTAFNYLFTMFGILKLMNSHMLLFCSVCIYEVISDYECLFSVAIFNSKIYRVSFHSPILCFPIRFRVHFHIKSKRSIAKNIPFYTYLSFHMYIARFSLYCVRKTTR